MNKVLEKNFKKHCKIALLSYLSKIDCKNAKNQQILGFVWRRRRRRKKAILKLLLRELKIQKFFFALSFLIKVRKNNIFSYSGLSATTKLAVTFACTIGAKYDYFHNFFHRHKKLIWPSVA